MLWFELTQSFLCGHPLESGRGRVDAYLAHDPCTDRLGTGPSYSIGLYPSHAGLYHQSHESPGPYLDVAVLHASSFQLLVLEAACQGLFHATACQILVV